MISHDERMVNQWRKEHKVLDFMISLCVLFILFGMIPMFFAVLYKLFGLVHSSTTAWIIGFLTTLFVMIIFSFKYTRKKGR